MVGAAETVSFVSGHHGCRATSFLQEVCFGDDIRVNYTRTGALRTESCCNAPVANINQQELSISFAFWMEYFLRMEKKDVGNIYFTSHDQFKEKKLHEHVLIFVLSQASTVKESSPILPFGFGENHNIPFSKSSYGRRWQTKGSRTVP
ncbi:hypothetical protein NC651_032340 [Populus alba x Populus x berolinensis]|nr:hypothetical protein NC651_032340 [Populus alba x Populus x berolinensis]